MNSPDTLISIIQRQIAHKMRDSLAVRWLEMRVALERVHVGKDPSVRYDTRADQAMILRDWVSAGRAFIEAAAPVFEHIAASAADFGGVRDQGFDDIRATFEDWLGLVEKAADNLEQEGAELRAEGRR